MTASQFPYVSLRDQVIFPGEGVYGIFVGGEDRIAAAKSPPAKANPTIFVSLQKDPRVKNVQLADVYRVGVLLRFSQVIEYPDGNLKLMGCDALKRARLVTLDTELGFPLATIAEMDESIASKVADEFQVRALDLIEAFDRMPKEKPRHLSASECRYRLSMMGEPIHRVTFLQNNILLPLLQKNSSELQELLEIDIATRLQKTLSFLQAHIKQLS